MDDYQAQLSKDREQIYNFILNNLPKGDSLVEKSVRYSVFPSKKGHLLRPLLLMKTAESYGISRDLFMPYVSAMEIMHVASLVLDDLPSMDNSSMRRGKPSCHTKFGVAIAELASHYLIALGQELILTGKGGNEKNHIILRNVNQAIKQVIHGQEQDLYDTQDMNLDQMLDFYRSKTGTFFALATTTGQILDNSRFTEFESLKEFGYNAGIAYQLNDDLLDVTSTEEFMGKPLNQDIRKKTPITILGLEKVLELRQRYVERAKSNLIGVKFTENYLNNLADVLFT